jgi:hypothetical protein
MLDLPYIQMVGDARVDIDHGFTMINGEKMDELLICKKSNGTIISFPWELTGDRMDLHFKYLWTSRVCLADDP